MGRWRFGEDGVHVASGPPLFGEIARSGHVQRRHEAARVGNDRDEFGEHLRGKGEAVAGG
jgi:hypothetical protein